MSSTDVHVIVVTHEGAAFLDACFGSLRRSRRPVHVIAVDNASGDGTPGEIRARFPEVELLESPRNLGFGGGCNIGLRRALELDARYVLLLNQDAAVEPETLDLLVAVLDADERAGIASPMHLDESGEALDYVFSTYLAPGRCKGLLSDLYLDRVRDSYVVERTNAAAWLLSRACLDRIGGFDPVLPHYGEDDDYVNRLHRHGLEVVVAPAARVLHESAKTPYEQLRWDPYRLYINSLVTLKDVRRGFTGQVIAHLGARAYEALKALVTLKPRRCVDLLVATSRAVFALPRIASSRKVSSREGPSYL